MNICAKFGAFIIKCTICQLSSPTKCYNRYSGSMYSLLSIRYSNLIVTGSNRFRDALS